MESIIRTIMARVSVRTYSPAEVPAKLRSRLFRHLEQTGSGPFGNKPRFVFVEDSGQAGARKIGTYGMITGARLYLAGAVLRKQGSLEDFGYCLESGVLKAAGLGLGTCWLGGTFNRSVFAGKLGLSGEEIIPCVTPVGFPAEKARFFEKAVRSVIGADGRREFGTLFFDGSPLTPLAPPVAGAYREVLECVRRAPSASNKQPWRVVRSADGKAYHFFMDEDRLYAKLFKAVRVQRVDMGIAMCHFEFAARELGLKGRWDRSRAPRGSEGWRYIVSWRTA